MSEDTTTTPAPEEATAAPQASAPVGQFATALTASNSSIRKSRALQLTEATKLVYRRRVEDLASEVRQLTMEAQGQLDLRGDSALSLNVASKDFDAAVWVQANVEARMSIRNQLTKLAVTYFGYTQLFGPDESLITGIDISKVDNAQIDIPLFD